MTTPTQPSPASYNAAYTFFQPDGNRIIAGHGTFPNVTAVDYPVSLPTWVIGSPDPSSHAWLVTSDQGEVRRVRPNGSMTVAQIAPRQAVAGVLTDSGFVPLLPDADELPFEPSPFTHPMVTPSGLLFVTTDGDLVLWRDGSEIARLAARPLPDARPALLSIGSVSGLAAIYAEPTDRYPHGVLGDTLEGAALLILRTDDLSVITRITLPEDEVFEGLQPLWADIDGDGQPEVVTTVSTAANGARIRVYRLDGTMAAQGEAFHRGGRLRHQLAFGPFGPEGEDELVVVRTPHVRGVIEYYRYHDGELHIVAEIEGYTSHVLHTRNLGLAVAGDFNGDGRLELVIPDQDREILAGIQRASAGPDDQRVEVIWSLAIGGLMVTNIAAMSITDSTGTTRLAIALGTSEDRLRVWR